MSVVPLLRRARVGLAADELLVTGALVLAPPLALGVRPLTAGLLWLAAVTPRLIAIDIAEHRLPDRILLPGYPVVLAAVTADCAVTGRPLGVPLAAAALYGVVLLVLHLAGGMGFGDVKLAPLLGLLLGAGSAAAALAGTLLAFLVGGVIAVGVLVRHGAGARMPFGPPMLLGAWAAVLLAT